MVLETYSYHVLRKSNCKVENKDIRNLTLVATEIRCTEESKGGLKYDVILSEAATTPRKRPTSPTQTVSEDDILEKLKAAEERRLSFEASKRNSLNSRFEKLEETLKKKEEEEVEKMKLQKVKLDKKLEIHNEKREAFLNEIKSKLKDHQAAIDKARSSLEKQEEAARAQTEEKLKQAEQLRQENISKMLDRLKMHDERGKQLRQSIECKKQELINHIGEKMATHKERLEIVENERIQKLKEKLKEHDQKVESVRQKKCKTPEDGRNPIENFA